MLGRLHPVDHHVDREPEQVGRVGDEERIVQGVGVRVPGHQEVDIGLVVVRSSGNGAEDSDVAEPPPLGEGQQLVPMSGESEGGAVVRRGEQSGEHLGGDRSTPGFDASDVRLLGSDRLGQRTLRHPGILAGGAEHPGGILERHGHGEKYT